jgi:hypothetical protein
VPSSPHTSSHVSGHHPATVRLAVGASGTQGLRALMAELPASGAHRAVELHGCCARASLAAALLSQHIDGVATAGSAGTKSGSSLERALLGPAHHVGARRREPHGFIHQGEGPATAQGDEANSIRSPTALRHGQLSSPWRSGRRFANFQRQRGPAGPWNYGFHWLVASARTHPVHTAHRGQHTVHARGAAHDLPSLASTVKSRDTGRAKDIAL